jgi:hypothetical protein
MRIQRRGAAGLRFAVEPGRDGLSVSFTSHSTHTAIVGSTPGKVPPGGAGHVRNFPVGAGDYSA